MNEQGHSRTNRVVVRAALSLALCSFLLWLLWGQPIGVLLPGLAVGVLLATGLILDVVLEGKRQARAEAGIVLSILLLTQYSLWFQMPFDWGTLVITVGLVAIAVHWLVKKFLSQLR